jgi:hypothetical protein
MVLKSIQSFWKENLKYKNYYQDLGLNGRILKCILKKQDGRVRTGFFWRYLVNTIMNVWVAENPGKFLTK